MATLKAWTRSTTEGTKKYGVDQEIKFIEKLGKFSDSHDCSRAVLLHRYKASLSARVHGFGVGKPLEWSDRARLMDAVTTAILKEEAQWQQ